MPRVFSLLLSAACGLRAGLVERVSTAVPLSPNRISRGVPAKRDPRANVDVAFDQENGNHQGAIQPVECCGPAPFFQSSGHTNDIAFVNKSAYLVTVGFGLHYTQDFDAQNPTWSVVDTGLGAAVAAVGASSDGQFVAAACGQVSTYNRFGTFPKGAAASTDGGKTWTVMAFPSEVDKTSTFRSLAVSQIKDARAFLICGSRGLFHCYNEKCDPLFQSTVEGEMMECRDVQYLDDGITSIASFPNLGVVRNGVLLSLPPPFARGKYASMRLSGSATNFWVYALNEGAADLFHTTNAIKDTVDWQVFTAPFYTNAEGNEKLLFIGQPGSHTDIALSPDGSRLYFCSTSTPSDYLPTTPMPRADVLVSYISTRAPAEPSVPVVGQYAQGQPFVQDAEDNVQAGANYVTGVSVGPHADCSNMRFRADGSLVINTDGGVFETKSINQNETNWQFKGGVLQNVEFYNGAYDPIGEWAVASAQDNGVYFIDMADGRRTSNWQQGDGGFAGTTNVDLEQGKTSVLWASFQEGGGFRAFIPGTGVEISNETAFPLGTSIKLQGKVPAWQGFIGFGVTNQYRPAEMLIAGGEFATLFQPVIVDGKLTAYAGKVLVEYALQPDFTEPVPVLGHASDPDFFAVCDNMNIHVGSTASQTWQTYDVSQLTRGVKVLMAVHPRDPTRFMLCSDPVCKTFSTEEAKFSDSFISIKGLTNGYATDMLWVPTSETSSVILLASAGGLWMSFESEGFERWVPFLFGMDFAPNIATFRLTATSDKSGSEQFANLAIATLGGGMYLLKDARGSLTRVEHFKPVTNFVDEQRGWSASTPPTFTFGSNVARGSGNVLLHAAGSGLPPIATTVVLEGATATVTGTLQANQDYEITFEPSALVSAEDGSVYYVGRTFRLSTKETGCNNSPCCAPTTKSCGGTDTPVVRCVCGFDPWCCTKEWDDQCVSEAQNACSLQCTGL